MDTFSELKEWVENQHYAAQRQKMLCDVTDARIDRPIVDLVNGFNKLSYCFTLQSCYGHFIHNGQNGSHGIEPLPENGMTGKVTYRIAYIAFCIENNLLGRELFQKLKEIPAIDPQNVQFCCAEWFWERQLNSYVLQVEPHRFKHKDVALVDWVEALHIEKVRNQFFVRLYALLENAEVE